MAKENKYNAALAKGQGLLEETGVLMDFWQPGMTSRELASRAVEQGVLGKATAKRVRDIISVHFARRFLKHDSRPAGQIKILVNQGVSIARLKQVLLVHTARANEILRDFVCEVYWPKYQAGALSISNSDAMHFIDMAYHAGKIRSKWSESMEQHIARGLTSTLAEFELLEHGRKSERKFVSFNLQKLTCLYLAHDIHFSGYGDNGLLEHPDWMLFGLEPVDVFHEVQRFSDGFFIPQYSGELLRISWQYQTMEEALHAIATAEL